MRQSSEQIMLDTGADHLDQVVPQSRLRVDVAAENFAEPTQDIHDVEVKFPNAALKASENAQTIVVLILLVGFGKCGMDAAHRE